MCLKVHRMALVSMVFVALTGAAPAFATTASIADPAGDSAPSADATTDLTRLDVVWDGSLRVDPTYAQPPPRSSRLDILVSAAARDSTTRGSNPVTVTWVTRSPRPLRAIRRSSRCHTWRER